jgi:hypothetical protein
MQSEIVNEADESELNKTLNRLFVNWIGWKVVLPLLLILSIYVLIRFILEIPEPFGRAFAHGDLLIFSALVLLEAATEGEHLQRETTKVMAVRVAVRILAILLIGGFIATKSDVLYKENQLLLQPNVAGQEKLSSKMLAYSWFNCGVALFSVVGSTLFFWFNVHRETKQQYKGFAQQKRPAQVIGADV